MEFGGNLLGQQAEMIPGSLTYGLTSAAGAGVAGQMGPQALLPEEIISIPLAFKGGYAFGNIKQMEAVEAGHAYKEMIDAGISSENAEKYATGVGLTNAVLEAAQLDELAKSLKVLKKFDYADAKMMM